MTEIVASVAVQKRSRIVAGVNLTGNAYKYVENGDREVYRHSDHCKVPRKIITATSLNDISREWMERQLKH